MSNHSNEQPTQSTMSTPSTPSVTAVKPTQQPKNQFIREKTAYRIYQTIDDYVTTYLAFNPGEVHQKWAKDWFDLYQFSADIGNPETNYGIANYAITNNAKATLTEVIETLYSWIPDLKNHFTITNVSGNGGIQYEYTKYEAFKTPTKMAPMQQNQDNTNKGERNTNEVNNNRYQALTADDDSSSNTSSNNSKMQQQSATKYTSNDSSKNIVEECLTTNAVISKMNDVTEINASNVDKATEIDSSESITNRNNDRSISGIQGENNTKTPNPDSMKTTKQDINNDDVYSNGKGSISKGNEDPMNINIQAERMDLKKQSNNRTKKIQMDSSSSEDESELSFEISLMEEDDEWTMRSHKSSKSRMQQKVIVSKMKKFDKFIQSKAWQNIKKLPKRLEKQYEKYDEGLYDTEQAIERRLHNYAKEATDTINHDRFVTAMKDKSAMIEQFKTECDNAMAASKQVFQNWMEIQTTHHKQTLHQLKIETTQQQLILKELKEEVKSISKSLEGINGKALMNADASVNAPPTTAQNQPIPTTPIPSTPIQSAQYSNPEGRTSIHVPNSYQQYPYDRIKFHHKGFEYTLNDKHFAKNHPQLPCCQSVDDAFTLYNIIQQHTAPYNIMITKISDLTKWNREPGSTPPTCALEFNNTTEYYQAYQAMKIAIYNLLTKVDFSKVGMYQAFIKHETNQDGFSALYSIMAMCHPKLMKRPRMECPTFKKCKYNIFQFCRSYQNYLDYELIENRTHSKESQLEYVIAQLDKHDKYSNAIMEMNTMYRIYQATIRAGTATPFPMELLLKNLPFTIISTFPPEEQATYTELDGDNMSPVRQHGARVHMMNDSFEEEESSDDIDALINRIGSQYGSRGRYNNGNRGNRHNSNRQMTTDRKRIDKTCPACGRHGHHIFENGCDFTAAHLKCVQFLQRYPEVKEQLMKNQKSHESNRRQSFLQKGAMKKIFKRKAKDARIHTVDSLINVLSETIDEALTNDNNDIQQSSSNDEIFLETYESEQGQAEEEEV